MRAKLENRKCLKGDWYTINYWTCFEEVSSKYAFADADYLDSYHSFLRAQIICDACSEHPSELLLQMEELEELLSAKD